MMVRINLLPREVLERRKAERLKVAAVGGAMMVFACFIALYGFNSWRIANAEADLAGLQKQVAKMNATIDTLRVYEARVQEVDRKKQIVAKALEDKIIWSKVLSELMIVTPNDVALETLEGNAEGVKFTGKIEDPGDTPDTGHKQVAKWLIRLGELKFQPDTWLTSSTKELEGEIPVKFISFENTMKFKAESKTPALPDNTRK